MSQVESNKLKQQLQLLAENVNINVYNQRKYLLGRILTIIEAVTNDPEQRKAIKDVVNDLFYQGSYWNDIKYHFQQMAEANGFEILPESILEPTKESLNIYKEV